MKILHQGESSSASLCFTVSAILDNESDLFAVLYCQTEIFVTVVLDIRILVNWYFDLEQQKLLYSHII